MNEELIQIYISQLLQGNFNDRHLSRLKGSSPIYQRMIQLELKCVREKNPEFQAALKILQSPLMGELK